MLEEGKMKLDYVLGLKLEDFLERRLQTQVRFQPEYPWLCLNYTLCRYSSGI